jgi:hypothetical protein
MRGNPGPPRSVPRRYCRRRPRHGHCRRRRDRLGRRPTRLSLRDRAAALLLLLEQSTTLDDCWLCRLGSRVGSDSREAFVVTEELAIELLGAGEDDGVRKRSRLCVALAAAARSAMAAVSGVIAMPIAEIASRATGMRPARAKATSASLWALAGASSVRPAWSARSTSSTARWWWASALSSSPIRTLASRISAPTRRASCRVRPRCRCRWRSRRVAGPGNHGRR